MASTYVGFIASGWGVATIDGGPLSVDSTVDLRNSMLLLLVVFERYEYPHLSSSAPIFPLFLLPDHHDTRH